MNKLLFISLFAFTVMSCNSENSIINTIDFEGVKDNIDIKFTDFTKEIKIIKLENKDSILIPDCNLLVNEEYIITSDKSKVVQFSAKDGKYIRTLMVAGGGPNEFTFLISSGIYKNKFYYINNGSNAIRSIDLSSGNFLEEFYLDIDIKKRFAVTNINSNGDLIIKNDSSLVSIYNLNNRKFIELKDNFILMPKEKSNSPSVLSVFGYTSNSSVAYIYNKNYSDTLYFIKDNKISPSSVLIFPHIKELGGEKLMGMSSQEGLNLFFPCVTNDNLFIQTLITGMNVTSSSISILKSPKSLYLYNIKSKLLSVVNKFNFNPLFEKVYTSGDKDENNRESLSAFFGYGYNKYFGSKRIAFAIPAYKVKDIIEDNLNDNSFTSSIKDKLMKLNNDLLEESNPVVVIGLLK